MDGQGQEAIHAHNRYIAASHRVIHRVIHALQRLNDLLDRALSLTKSLFRIVSIEGLGWNSAGQTIGIPGGNIMAVKSTSHTDQRLKTGIIFRLARCSCQYISTCIFPRVIPGSAGVGSAPGHGTPWRSP